MALFIILPMGYSGFYSCLAQGEETIAQVIPGLVVVDALDAAIFAADATYLYGSSGNKYSVLARFGTQDHKASAGYDFGEGKSIGRVWTTSVEGEVFASVGESAFETLDLYRSTDYGETFTKVLVLGDAGFGGHIPDVSILHRGFYEAMIGSSRKLLVGEYNVNNERVPGSTNDQVRIMQSTDGDTWTPLYTFNTDGVHQIRHIHVITQDPISGWIYFGLGDSRAESAILAWDGVVAWPEEKLALSEFRGLDGFYISSSSISVPRVIVTDILFPPHDDFLYVCMDDYPSSIQRYSRDLTFSEQVYPTVDQGEYPGSVVRLGVIATGPNGGAVQIWHDTGNAATDPDRYDPPSDDNFVTFYVSREDSFGPGAWDAVGRYNLSKPGKQVPRNFLVHNNRIYFSAFSPAGKGQSLTAVFQVGGEFSGERLETISPAFWIATDGDDGNNGRSVSTPWQTVTRLADQAVTYGSIVLIAAGQYPVANDLSLDFSNVGRPGPTGLEVVIRGEGPGVTTVAFGPSAPQGFQSKEPSSDRFMLEMLTTTGNWGANHYGSVAADTILGRSGIDTIYGYAGDDILDGGQGNDRLIGGSGKDTFLFTGANGMDTIADFELSSDFIRLVGYGIGNPNDLFITQQGPDAVIDLTESGGGRITLVGIDATQLGNSHFAFE
jgi:hypothetical protein